MSKQQEFQPPSFVPSTDNYLVRHFILEYLNDSIHQLLETKNSNPKIDVLEFFTEYFKSVKQGTHILFREYNFIVSTPHNRSCFIEKFLETFFSMIDKEDEMLKVCDYHALILLLCHDFPIEIVEKSLKIISSADVMTCYFKDFIYAFQFQFYYKEFINESKIIFDNLKFSPSRSLDDGLKNKFNSSKFLDFLENLRSQVNYSFPPKSALKDAIQAKDDDPNYTDFLKELCNSEKVTIAIDRIPVRSRLHEFKKTTLKTPSEKNPTLADSGENTETDTKKEQSTITSLDSSNFPRNQKSAAIAKLGKKNVINNMQSDNSRTSSSDSSSDTDT